ncbi:hypothetical protein JCM1840_002199 [Sporobolomyces johnsonii]
MASTDAPPPDPASEVPVPAFKKKRRPGAKLYSRDSPSLSDSSAGGAASTSATRDATPLSGFDAADDGEDQTSETLEQLLALRRLKRSTAGLELERLNAGERKKRPKASEAGEGTVVTKEGMVEGTHGGLQGGRDRLRDDGDAPEAKARKIVKSDNFTGQTNTVDVDKHMMAYIEAELQKKRSGLDPSAPAASTSNKPYDPRDELYKVAEKYKFADVAAQEKGKKDKDDEEGNVTLSTSMLMGIPEVDLGIDTKLKNIEATEKAKRQLYDAQMAARKKAEEDKEEFAVDRFYRHHRPLESDADALAKARAAALNPAEAEVEEEHRRTRAAGRRETATDDMAMERFKKRQRQNWGK